MVSKMRKWPALSPANNARIQTYDTEKTIAHSLLRTQKSKPQESSAKSGTFPGPDSCLLKMSRKDEPMARLFVVGKPSVAGIGLR